MRFISWNVNGLRAIVNKGFYDFFESIEADVFALQETKLQAGQIDLLIPNTYHQVWSYAERKGYSGTAVFSKNEPLKVEHTIGHSVLDTEGRVCALEFEKFWFIDVYTPNAQDELKRIDLKVEWDNAFRKFVSKKAKKKPVIICGDLNVAHQEIDLKNPKPNMGKAGFSDEERADFTKLLEAGFIDTFRYLYPDKTAAYSWWSYRGNARANNAGWRLDYFVTSKDLKDKITSADILSEVMGSDHCPVLLELDL
jgi:exodeoxyribonuclease-3